jgi:glyoxylase-like metal-dependent hydrolase (beta-lactamase superfamily II)
LDAVSKIIYQDAQLTVFQSALYKTNSTVVSLPAAVLVVDPCWLPEEVERIVRFVENIREDRPVHLFFTHSDYDHILGYAAFHPDRVFLSTAMQEHPEKLRILEQIRAFDDQYYLDRPYPILFPIGTDLILTDETLVQVGAHTLVFYPMPGHTEDSAMLIIPHLQCCLIGDYLSDVEFPLVDYQYSIYLETLHKLQDIDARYPFVRLIPGHGTPTPSREEWKKRQSDDIQYLNSLRETVVDGVAYDPNLMWNKYPYPIGLQKCHELNLERVKNALEP